MNAPTTIRRPCVVCGAESHHATGGCTNACCAACHGRYCTPGGATTPGHGINVERARQLHAMRGKLEADALHDHGDGRGRI